MDESQIDRTAASLIDSVLLEFKDSVFAQILANQISFYQSKKSKRDNSTIALAAKQWFDQEWDSLDGRIGLVPGKQVFSRLNFEIHKNFGVNVTASSVLNSANSDMFPEHFKSILMGLNEFAE